MTQPPTTEITAETFGNAIVRAEKFLKENTEQSLLASTLLIINALEASLNQLIYLEHQRSMNDILTHKLEKVKRVPTLYGYDLEKILEKISLREKATLGEIINHIEKYLFFPEKEGLMSNLKKVNMAREKIVHQLLMTSQKSGLSNEYLRKQVLTVVESSKAAIIMSFEIGDKSGKVRESQANSS